MISDSIRHTNCFIEPQDKPPIIRRGLVVCTNRERGTKVRIALERFCFSVDVVHTGLEAMKLIHFCCPYDIIITELLLDEISGFALASVARRFRDVATIGINNGNTCMKVIANEFGMDRVLDPPLNLRELGQLSVNILGTTYDSQ